jgi:hypothetical protein
MTVIIEHRPCPRCQIPNTARFADGVAVCFNCQASWDPNDPERTLIPPRRGPQAQETQAREARARQPEPEPAPYAFSAPELARLAVYRDAVRAGFFNEGLEEESSSLEASPQTPTLGES